MCGIAGILGRPDRPAVERMAEAMWHRGPDDVGLYEDTRVVLGHRRLSVIDLSAAGHQPMSGADGRLWIVYNGEIYNFMELKRMLEGRGHVFRSRTDTEVILALYEEFGTECVARLRGMFAFAIWDLRGDAPLLFLARDHFGIKPLLYATTPDSFVFASDLPAILESGRVSRSIDRVALVQYLMHGHVVQPRTILSGVRMLPPGCAMTVHPSQTPRLWSYWDLDHAHCAALSADLSFGEQAGRVRALLEESARAQMVSDVPLGAFLSGGIDSCALVALMMRVSGRPVHTFSVGFADEGSGLDESSDARRSAQTLGSVHVDVQVTGREVAESLPSIAAHLGQPTVDGVNMYLVSKAARRGVTVALAGLGGDELFAGYASFASLRTYWGSGTSARRRLGALLGRSAFWRALPRSPVRRRWELRTLQTDPASHFMVSHMIRPPSEALRLAGLQDVDRGELFAYRREDDPRVGDIVSRVSRLETRLYMGSQLLRDTDAASMAHSLEVRVPFLDIDLAEFAYGLPGSSKLGPREADGAPGGKRVLIEAVKDLLPEWTYRKPKRGFTMPFEAWLRGPLRTIAADVFASATFRASGLVDAREVDRVWSRFLSSGETHWTTVWTPLILGLWWLNGPGSRAEAWDLAAKRSVAVS